MPLDGEAIKQVFEIIRDNNITAPRKPPVLPEPIFKECCGECSQKVFADPETAASDLSNDFAGPHAFFPSYVSSAQIFLQKWSSSIDDYEDVAEINDLTYASRYEAFGQNITERGDKFIGARVEWFNVISDTNLGEGSYRFRIAFSSFLGSAEYIYNDIEYCLHQFRPEKINETVRFEYSINKVMGVNQDDNNIRDYMDLNWFDMLRFSGVFNYEKSEYTRNTTVYNNHSRKWIEDVQEPEFGIIIKPICWQYHQLMRTDVLQADEIFVTDYNSQAYDRGEWIRKSVQATTGYAPNFFKNQNKKASVTELKFRQAQNNLFKRR